MQLAPLDWHPLLTSWRPECEVQMSQPVKGRWECGCGWVTQILDAGVID